LIPSRSHKKKIDAEIPALSVLRLLFHLVKRTIKLLARPKGGTRRTERMRVILLIGVFHSFTVAVSKKIDDQDTVSQALSAPLLPLILARFFNV